MISLQKVIPFWDFLRKSHINSQNTSDEFHEISPTKFCNKGGGAYSKFRPKAEIFDIFHVFQLWNCFRKLPKQCFQQEIRVFEATNPKIFAPAAHFHEKILLKCFSSTTQSSVTILNCTQCNVCFCLILTKLVVRTWSKSGAAGAKNKHKNIWNINF